MTSRSQLSAFYSNTLGNKEECSAYSAVRHSSPTKSPPPLPVPKNAPPRNTPPVKMRRRYATGVFLFSLVVLLLPPPILTANATCPYDVDTASHMIPPACYANATATAISAPTTSCCWFVFAAYIYAAARYANHTGTAFLPNPAAASCSDAFSATLIGRGLVHPSLLSNTTCSLSGNPVPLAAGNRPCQYATVAAVRSDVDLSNATLLCAAPAVDLSGDQPSCLSCQNAVIAAVFALFNATGSKEFVACGMAATIAIWSSFPSLNKFRSYALCMVQVLENVGNLATGNLISSPPPPFVLRPSPAGGSFDFSRSAKVAVGSASAGVASIAAIVWLVLATRKGKKRSSQVNGEDQYRDPTAAIRSTLLPTEGLYIFTKAELKQATNDYDDRLLLGEGGAGKVYLGKLPSGQQVAIKRIYREKKLSEFYGEVEILAKLRHRNLTTMVGYCLGEQEHVLVYEYMAGGNLAQALHGGELAWRLRVRIAVDVAEGLAYLHEFPEGAVVHRDVKPTNVLLSADAASAKLSDFGVSRIVPSDLTHLSTEVRGTMGYVDPDSFSVGHVSETADVYSFGVVLLELVTGMRAVVPTPSGGAESIVHAARGAIAAAEAAGDASLVSVVDPRLGLGFDRPSVTAVFETACRSVRPYKEERPTMAEVLGVLKRVLEDLDSRMSGAASTPPSTEDISEEFSAPSTSTTSAHAWSL